MSSRRRSIAPLWWRAMVAAVALATGLSLGPLADADSAATPVCSGGTCTVTFGYDGSTAQSFAAPAGVSMLTVAAFGAAGAPADFSGSPGLGGKVSGQLPVAAGNTLSIDVGGAGAANSAGAFGGGTGWAGGGGYSLVTLAGTTEFIAGGGGGGGQFSNQNGTLGSGAAGGAGGQPSPGASAGTGTSGNAVSDAPGTQQLGGGDGGGGASSAARGSYGAAGQVGGGTACSGGSPVSGNTGAVGSAPNLAGADGGAGGPLGGGGGGGGGYAGGGGGGGGADDAHSPCSSSGAGGGGGGGSSYAGAETISPSYSSGVQAGDGQVVITYADPITARNLTYTATVGQALAVAASQGVVGAGAQGSAGSSLSASQTTPPGHGSLALNLDGSFTYTPSANFVGTDTFGYELTDSSGDEASATVTVQVSPAAPVVSIASPSANGVYGAGSQLTSSFTCSEGAGGSGIARCVDQDGQPSGSALSTASPGSYTETVTATSHDGLSSTQTVSYTVVGPPVPAIGPKLSGTLRARDRLSCAAPSFSGDPTSIGYTWERDGTAIVGATTSTYTIATGDEGSQITCVVAATGPGGASAPAASTPATIPVPHVKGCPAATGSAHGTHIGPLALGQSATQVRRADRHATIRGSKGKPLLCLTPAGIRIGFVSTKQLGSLPRSQRARYRGRVIWLSTANASYAIKGIRDGATVVAARLRLHLSQVLVVGANDWYLASDGKVLAVLKVRHDIVEEIGIADKALVGHTRRSERTFLDSFS